MTGDTQSGSTGEVAGKLGHLLRFVEQASRGQLEYVSSGSHLVDVTETALAASTNRAAVASDDRVVARVSTGASTAADSLWLSISSPGLTPLVRQAVRDIEQSSRKQNPSQPMPSDAGELVHVLALVRKTRRALEIGTSTGASTLWLASALAGTNGKLTSIERDSARHTAARRNVKRCGLEDKVDLRLGEFERWTERLPGSIDLVLLDEDIDDRPDHLMALRNQLAKSALVISHGGGSEPTAAATYKALARTMPRTTSTVSIAVGDGLTLTLME